VTPTRRATSTCGTPASSSRAPRRRRRSNSFNRRSLSILAASETTRGIRPQVHRKVLLTYASLNNSSHGHARPHGSHAAAMSEHSNPFAAFQ